MLLIIEQVMEEKVPELQDLLLVQNAILEAKDIYQPLGLVEQLQGRLMDVSVLAPVLLILPSAVPWQWWWWWWCLNQHSM